jgi:hypothetical protein
VQLVTSLTVDASLLRKLLKLWDEGGDPRNPFASVLVTPLFASPSTLKLIREELKEKRGATVYFDSGGYYAQQGRINFNDLYCRLREYYADPQNQWADWYVLPDNVPTSSDSVAVVDTKVKDTITASRMLFAEMPFHIQERSIPVIQGHTYKQVNDCISTFSDMGVNYMGFGSFGTNGSNSSVNVADSRSALIVEHIASELTNKGVNLHTFGMSTPPVIYAFQKLGVSSFDSLAWQRSAGYGKVYMPFTRAYNVSHRSTRNSALTYSEFSHLRERTHHQCPFCEDFQLLSNDRLHRSLHNLVAVMETIDAEHQQKIEGIPKLIQWRSKRYFKLFREIYLDI